MAELPAYSAFAGAADPSLQEILREDRRRIYQALQEKARIFGELHGLKISTCTVDGREVTAIVDFLRERKSDLLVVGLHPRDLYIWRLWSTVYELAQDAPCSVLGVH
jgi:nucleotide-binding universal stress UspA family protein